MQNALSISQRLKKVVRKRVINSSNHHRRILLGLRNVLKYQLASWQVPPTTLCWYFNKTQPIHWLMFRLWKTKHLTNKKVNCSMKVIWLKKIIDLKALIQHTSEHIPWVYCRPSQWSLSKEPKPFSYSSQVLLKFGSPVVRRCVEIEISR